MNVLMDFLQRYNEQEFSFMCILFLCVCVWYVCARACVHVEVQK